MKISACRKTEELKAFFDHWKTYQKAMDHDYLGHRGAYSLLGSFLAGRFPEGFSILDLGCGDAGFMARTLAPLKVRSYCGVDLSETVLSMARNNMGIVPCSRDFINADFVDFIEEGTETADVIWIGLSLHHLTAERKEEFLAKCLRRLNVGGFLLVYEPMRLANESRKQYLKRWLATCENHWPALDPHEKKHLFEHVCECDFPENLSAYQAMGKRAGFQKVTSLFGDAWRIHELVCFHA